MKKRQLDLVFSAEASTKVVMANAKVLFEVLSEVVAPPLLVALSCGDVTRGPCGPRAFVVVGMVYRLASFVPVEVAHTWTETRVDSDRGGAEHVKLHRIRVKCAAPTWSTSVVETRSGPSRAIFGTMPTPSTHSSTTTHAPTVQRRTGTAGPPLARSATPSHPSMPTSTDSSARQRSVHRHRLREFSSAFVSARMSSLAPHMQVAGSAHASS